MTKFYKISDSSFVKSSHESWRGYNIDQHLHDVCEIVYFIKGAGTYTVCENAYDFNKGDIFITRTEEVHGFEFNNQNDHESIYVQFDPHIIGTYINGDMDLLACFNNRKLGIGNKVDLTSNQRDGLSQLIFQMSSLCKNENVDGYKTGNNLLKYAKLIEILVYLNRIYKYTNLGTKLKIDSKMQSLLEYIDAHLSEKLTLELFEKEFFINKHYLCRLFKKNMGMNLHTYISFRRVNYSKVLLENGAQVAEAAREAGFGEYSNFIRAFKKVVGIKPGEYKKIITNSR